MRTLANGKPLPQRTVKHTSTVNATQEAFWPLFLTIKAGKALVWITTGAALTRTTNDAELALFVAIGLTLSGLLSLTAHLFRKAIDATHNRA